MAISPAMIDLKGKKGLVIGIANQHSIAYGCAEIFRASGAELAITYLNEKAEPYVRPLALQLEAPHILPCDVEKSGELESVFDCITKHWGKLDFLLHAVAFAPKEDLHGRVVDCSLEGFLTAMDVSCHSFLRMAKLAEPLMKEGGSLLTLSYYGSEKVVENYNMMGPVKAALESAVRYMSVELGAKNIRVNTISPGPIMTRAASGIAHFDEMIARAKSKSALRRVVNIEDVGYLAAFLVSDYAANITGNIHYIDAGYEAVD